MSEVKYNYIEHWIPKQAEAEKAMLAEFEAGNYTLENPLVKYNPYFINPLAAVVLFKTEKETAITVTVKDAEAQAWVQKKLGEGVGTVVIYVEPEGENPEGGTTT